MRNHSNLKDYFNITLDYGNNVIVTLRATCLAKIPNPRFIVHGTEGSLIIEGLDPQEAQILSGMKPTSEGYGVVKGRFAKVSTLASSSDLRSENVEILKGDYSSFFLNVHEAIVQNDPSLLKVSADEGAFVMKILEAAAQSYESGRVVEII